MALTMLVCYDVESESLIWQTYVQMYHLEKLLLRKQWHVLNHSSVHLAFKRQKEGGKGQQVRQEEWEKV